MPANRPPLAKAREAATKALIANHQPEYDALVQDYLKAAGWGRETVTKEVWRKQACVVGDRRDWYPDV